MILPFSANSPLSWLSYFALKLEIKCNQKFNINLPVWTFYLHFFLIFPWTSLLVSTIIGHIISQST